MVETIRFVRGQLPHWLVADHSYFITLRLKGSLPSDVVKRMREERAQLQRTGADEDACADLRRRQFVQLETSLDASLSGPRWLSDPKVAPSVLRSMQWLEESRGWTIRVAVLMPTHAHILMRNTAGRNGELLHDLASFKNYSGREANKVLGRQGHFWAAEDFDHWCRDRGKLEGVAAYIRNNPVKAGLVSEPGQWLWFYPLSSGHLDPTV